MKIPFLLLALILSAQGWCANSIPSGRVTRAVIPVHQAIENEQPQPSLGENKMKTAVIGCILLTYLAVIIWWVIATKHSLDNILKEVLHGMAQY